MTIELTPGGLLIAIEGIDGAGKTTLARSLATLLEQAGARVVLSKEPTNGPWGTQLRQSAATGRLSAQDEVDLLLRDRREHVEALIAPALARGEIVILDRYFPSMVAYQGAAGLPLDTLLAANDFAPRPDLLLLLDLPPPTGLARIRKELLKRIIPSRAGTIPHYGPAARGQHPIKILNHRVPGRTRQKAHHIPRTHQQLKTVLIGFTVEPKSLRQIRQISGDPGSLGAHTGRLINQLRVNIHTGDAVPQRVQLLTHPARAAPGIQDFCPSGSHRIQNT